MPSNDRTSGAADDRDSTDESVDSEAGASADADAPAEPDASASADSSVPEGFGEVPPDREGSRWGGYVLAGLLAVVFLVGLVRLASPSASNLVVATLLTLFGLLVGLVAVRNRLRGS